MFSPNFSGFSKPFTSFCPRPESVETFLTLCFGLYGNRPSVFDYLEDFEADEIASAMVIHELNMMSMDVEEQGILLDIVSKRYVDEIDRAGKMLLFDAKQASVRSQSAVMDARIAAVASDFAALKTLENQLTVAIKKQEVRIEELVVRAETEKVNSAFVDAEVAQKYLEAAKAELEELRGSQKILEYQIQIVENAYELSKIPADIAALRAEVAELTYKKAAVEAQLVELDSQRISLVAELEDVKVREIHSSGELEDFRFKSEQNLLRVEELEAEIKNAEAQYKVSASKEQELRASIESLLAKIKTTRSKSSEADYEIAKTLVEESTIKANAAQHLLSAASVDEARALYEKSKAEGESWADRLEAIRLHIEALNKESGAYGSGGLREASKTLFEARKDTQSARHEVEIAKLDGDTDYSNTQRESSIKQFAAKIATAKEKARNDRDVADLRYELSRSKANAYGKICYAKVKAAEMLSKAKLSSSVMHSIGGS